MDSAAFIARVSEQLKKQGKVFDPDRYFCEEDQLLRVEGRTYALTNQWGATTQDTIDAWLTAFGTHGITIEARDSD